MPVTCGLDRGPKKVSSGPGGSQVGGVEYLSVSEILEVWGVRAQSPGPGWGVRGRAAGRGETGAEARGRARTSSQWVEEEVKCVQLTHFPGHRVCECALARVRASVRVVGREQCEWNERKNASVEGTGWKKKTTCCMRRSLGYSRRKGKTLKGVVQDDGLGCGSISFPTKESSSWLKTHVWFSRPDRRQLQRCHPAGLMGANTTLPTADLVTARALPSLKGAVVHGSGR